MFNFLISNSIAGRRLLAITSLLLCTTISACLMTRVDQSKLIANDGAAGDSFGFSVALSGDTALIGAFKDDDDTLGVDAGSAYVFVRSAKIWKQQAKLTAIDGAANDTFGGNVALFGDTAVIGAMRDDDKGENSGSVYMFTRSEGDWSQFSKFTATDTVEGDAFGQSIALAADTMVIGAPRDDDQGKDSGSAYVFTRSGKVWSQQAKLTAADGAEGDLFGISATLSGNTLLVGADLNDEKANNAGAVYVFERSGNNWYQQAKLMAADGGDTDIFGVRVALSGDTALISARRDDDDLMGVDAGSAYVFTRSGKKWHQQAKLTAPDGEADDRFGRSVAIKDNTAIIGAMHHDDQGDNSGAAYLFVRSGNIWSHQTTLMAEYGASGDLFGFSVAISKDTVLVAATGSGDNGDESGSAYLFELDVD